MSKRRRCYCCCNNAANPCCYCSNVANSSCFGNICNPFCLVVLLIALKKGGIIQDQCTIEALFFIFLLLCCCSGCGTGTGVRGYRYNRACRCCC